MKSGTANRNDIGAIPQVSRAEVRILWANDFWDVPLQGMAEVGGRRCLFDIIDRDLLGTEDELHRYWLIALNPEQFRYEESWHDLFCRKVGTHFDYTGWTALPAEQQLPYDEFYEPYRLRAQPDYARNEIVGWFRL